jgi:nitroreductase
MTESIGTAEPDGAARVVGGPGEVAAIDDVLSTARSVRRNLDFQRPIEPHVIHQCIDVAVQAPTGAGGENWRFVVVTEAVIKERIARLYEDVLTAWADQRQVALKPSHRALVERLHEIPAMIFVCVDGEPAGASSAAQVAHYGSILPAAWSLMLALRARGIGATWTSLLCQRRLEVARILDMPDHVELTVMLPVGYTKGAVLKRAVRRPAREVTFWNGWGRSDA